MEEGCRLTDHGRGTPCTQDRVMAYSRLLLLLIGVMYLVQARPSDFWCNRQARRTMEKKIEGLRTDMVACVGADTLPSPVQLPCVWLHAAEWENKTLQQKCAEVVGALRVFQDGVEGTKNRSTSECQTSLLGKLEHHIANYVAIVSRLQTQVIRIDNGTVTPSRSAVRNCSSATSTSKVLQLYGNLLKGKLERLAVDLRDDVPKAEQRTTTTKGRCS